MRVRSSQGFANFENFIDRLSSVLNNLRNDIICRLLSTQVLSRLSQVSLNLLTRIVPRGATPCCMRVLTQSAPGCTLKFLPTTTEEIDYA